MATSERWIVHKFGGSSVADAECFARVASLLEALPPGRLAVVLSACRGVTDALLGQYQGGPAGYLQYATVLNQVWLSHDPVALDVLSLKELAREAKMFGTLPVPSESEIYTNAALLELGANDPSRIRIEKVRNF